MTARTSIPSSLFAGDSLDLSLTRELYPADAGWALRLELAGPGDAVAWTGTGVGAVHSFEVTTADTAGLAAGRYGWQLVAVKTAKRVTLESGQLLVKPNLTTASDYDPRTRTQRQLDAVNAAIDTLMGDPLAEYSVAGRTFKKHNLTELIAWRSQLEKDLLRERARQGKGGAVSRPIFVRWGRS